MQQTVVILGARGRMGLAAARAFVQAGWRVFGQIRAGTPPPALAGVHWLTTPLHDTAALAAQAQGASVLVHALNPPYTDAAWRTQAPALLESALALARALDATVLLPGNVYNFGAGMPALLREDTPQLPSTEKGRIRVALEQRLAQSGLRSVVIRSGDFFGSGSQSWFDLVLTKDLARGRFTYPGALDVATPWAYLPDLARVFVAVAEQRAQLPPFAVLHVAGQPISGRQWCALLEPIARQQRWLRDGAQLEVRAMPWRSMRALSWLAPRMASLLAMRYLWDTPHALDNTRLTALIGAEPRTELALAVRLAVEDLGLCAPA